MGGLSSFLFDLVRVLSTFHAISVEWMTDFTNIFRVLCQQKKVHKFQNFQSINSLEQNLFVVFKKCCFHCKVFLVIRFIVKANIN